MATKKTALAVKPKGNLSPLSAEMAAEAKEGVATFASGSPRISFKGGRISIDKEPIAGNKLPIAIIDTVVAKAYYDQPYEEGKPATPVCYAFHATDPAALTPHAAVPEKQADSCAQCPMNKFGTALVGKGKACHDEVRVMGVVPSEDDFTGAESRMFTITGNSLRTWNDYIADLKMKQRSPRTVVTEVSTEPFKSAFRQTFTHYDDLTEEQFAALKSRREAAKEQMMQPYPVIGEDEEAAPAPAPKKGKKGAKF